MEVDGKSVQDRYERMQKAFDDGDKRDEKLSGVGGGLTEAEELLSMMREARDNALLERARGKKDKKSREMKKLAAGQRVVGSVMKLLSAAIVVGEDEGENSKVESKGGGKRKKCRVINHAQRFEEEMKRFGPVLKECDEGLLEFERQKVELEKKRFDMESKERAEDQKERAAERELHREEQKADRETTARMEMEKFKVMMETLKSVRKD